jgi:fructan beta-fructosidase
MKNIAVRQGIRYQPAMVLNVFSRACLVLMVVVFGQAQLRAADVVIANFNSPSFGNWKATGDAFSKGPVSGVELLRKLEIENSPDAALASSEIDGDAPQGSLTSEPFKIQRRYISFLIAGGDYERHTCLNLLIDGKIARSATGRRRAWR